MRCPISATLRVIEIFVTSTASRIATRLGPPIFRTARGRTKTLTDNAVTENVIYRMLRRRLKDAELPHDGVFKPHSFRAATITDLLAGGAELRHVQKLAGHADPRTTQLYDHSDDSVTQNLVEKISYRVKGAAAEPKIPEEEPGGH